MALNPVPAITYVALWGAYTSIVLTGTAAVSDVGVLPECADLSDVLSGCNSTVSKILALGVLGTVPGAPNLVNVFFAVLGLAARASIIWSIIEVLRGT